ncbi:MAG: hypothetical protein KDC59_15520, partial [Saprospiraceae bacterium]|nr:hypothetical protein [Saprospiraceae bacterium]
IIDHEVRSLIDDAYVKAKEILNNHRHQLNELAELLIKKEVVHQDEIRKVANHLPANLKTDYVSQCRSI